MSLDLDNRVLILGAGASTIAGIPIVSTFFRTMQKARPWLQQQDRIRESTAIEEVTKFRMDHAKAGYRTKLNLDNIEHLFSYAVIADPKSGMADNIRLAIAATIDYAASNAQLPTMTARATSDANRGFIPSFFQQKDDVWSAPSLDYAIALLYGHEQVCKRTHRLNILSFNYDTMIEDCLVRLRIPYRYGIRKRHSDMRNNTQRDLKPLIDSDSLFLAKLHGSLNWYNPRKRGKKFTIVDSYEDLFRMQGVPELIPPISNKSANEYLSGVWSEAIECLATATEIVFIGYSFPETDHYVQHLLAAGLAKNITLQSISIIDPNAKSVAGRIRTWIVEDRIPQAIQIFETRMDSFCNDVHGIWKSLKQPQFELSSDRWFISR